MLRVCVWLPLLLCALFLIVSPVMATPTSSQLTCKEMAKHSDPSGTALAESGIPLRPFVRSELDEMLGDTIRVSTTWRDQLGTASNTRFLAYTVMDEDYPQGVVKIVWQEQATSSDDRLTKYVEVYEEEGDLHLSHILTVGIAQDGFPVLDIDASGNQWPALHSPHREGDGRWDPAICQELVNAPGFYGYMWVDRYDIATTVWPGLAMQNTENHLYGHMINFVGDNTSPYNRYVYYYRMDIGDELYENATPGDEAQLQITTYDEDWEGCIAANDESGVVAVVVPISRKLKDGEDNGFYDNHRIAQTCNDIYLWVSQDNGDTWDFENGGYNITNFIPPNETLLPDTNAANQDTLRGFADVNLVVDNEGIVHVTFTTPSIDYYRSRGESSYSAHLWYWNSRDSLCIQMQEYFWNGVVPGSWQTFTNQCQLAVDRNTGWIWAAWSQFGEKGDTLHYIDQGTEYWTPVDFSQSTSPNTGQNFALGDIYVAASPDGHRWTKPVNVTNTRDVTLATALAGGVLPGNCRSEIQPSLAENVNGDYIHLFYLQDRDGGRAYNWIEGVTTEGELIYQRISKVELINKFNEQAAWIPNYPIHVDSTRFWVDPDNWAWTEDLVPCSVSDREGTELAPDQFELEHNYPNPFNPSTRIAFNLKHSGKVKLAVYDVLGREIATLVNRAMSPGSHYVTFLADDLPSGVYFCKLSSGNAVQVRKMVLMK